MSTAAVFVKPFATDVATNTESPAPTTTRKRGGRPGNTNAQRHGLRSAKLPAGCKYIEHAIDHFREQLEAATIAAHGEINVLRAALISSAIRHEKRAALCERFFRLADESLKIVDRAGLLREVSQATDSRDRCIERLRLDRDRTATLIETLYGPSPRSVAQDDAGRDTNRRSTSQSDSGTDAAETNTGGAE